jgi:GNAT superfamily N-acetyltransferase
MYKIRPLDCLDVKSCKDIFYDIFHPSEWPEFNWIWRYRSKQESLGIFTHDGLLVGFVFILAHSRNLKYIAVQSDFQYKKLGSRLLKAVLRNCLHLNKGLNLTPANDFVMAWYERHGFRVSSSFLAADNSKWHIMNFHTRWTRSNSLKLRHILSTE